MHDDGGDSGLGSIRTALPSRELTGAVIGAFYRVYNALGHGFLESVHKNALMVEFRGAGIPFAAEVELPVRYRGVDVGLYRADLLVGESSLVEVKSSHTV